MKEIEVTKFSLEKTNEIISKMDSHSFHNHFHILYDLCNHFTNDITYLEIGCFAGASASLMSSHTSVKKVFSIDLGRPIKKKIAEKNVSKFKHKFCEYNYFEGNSNDSQIISQVKKNVESVDIFFIDGDHSYSGVLSDFSNYSELVKPSGYIAFDDYLDFQYSPDVKNAVDFIVRNIDKKQYEVIGSISYNLLAETNLPDFKSSNLFLLKKL